MRSRAPHVSYPDNSGFHLKCFYLEFRDNYRSTSFVSSKRQRTMIGANQSFVALCQKKNFFWVKSILSAARTDTLGQRPVRDFRIALNSGHEVFQFGFNRCFKPEFLRPIAHNDQVLPHADADPSVSVGGGVRGANAPRREHQVIRRRPPRRFCVSIVMSETEIRNCALYPLMISFPFFP
jgi:hypothetical protein